MLVRVVADYQLGLDLRVHTLPAEEPVGHFSVLAALAPQQQAVVADGVGQPAS